MADQTRGFSEVGRRENRGARKPRSPPYAMWRAFQSYRSRKRFLPPPRAPAMPQSAARVRFHPFPIP
jgi:hypothetical protein